MPTPAANLIPQDESTFNRPGFWDFVGGVQIGGGAVVLPAGSYVGKAVLTPEAYYLVVVEIGDIQPDEAGGFFNLNVGGIVNGESRAFNAPGRYEFRMKANGTFFGAISNGGTAIVNLLEVYPVTAYETPPAATPAPAPQKKSAVPVLFGLAALVWLLSKS